MTITVGLLQHDTMSAQEGNWAGKQGGRSKISRLGSQVETLNPSSSELVVVAVVVAHIGLTFGRKPWLQSVEKRQSAQTSGKKKFFYRNNKKYFVGDPWLLPDFMWKSCFLTLKFDSIFLFDNKNCIAGFITNYK